MTHRTDNLVRLRYDTDAVELRADDDGDGRTMFGHFAVFDQWTEINSWYEGRFLERIRPTAFDRTFAERGDKIRVLYDHGHDPSIGSKPLGAPDVLRADKVGAYYESALFDAGYVNELVPALRAGQLGASFRFAVTGEERVEPKRASKHNPDKLLERSVTEVDLYEFGPVPFGAYAAATAGVRSDTDRFIEELLGDEDVLAAYIERAGPSVAAQFLASLPSTVGHDDAASRPVPAVGGSDTRDNASARSLARARHALLV